MKKKLRKKSKKIIRVKKISRKPSNKDKSSKIRKIKKWLLSRSRKRSHKKKKI